MIVDRHTHQDDDHRSPTSSSMAKLQLPARTRELIVSEDAVRPALSH
jgi:hypothetical protein